MSLSQTLSDGFTRGVKTAAAGGRRNRNDSLRKVASASFNASVGTGVYLLVYVFFLSTSHPMKETEGERKLFFGKSSEKWVDAASGVD